MSGTFPATNADLYAVVDLTKKKSESAVSSKNKKSDIPVYHVLELSEDKSHKVRKNSSQLHNPQGLYSEIDYSKKSQKSSTTIKQPTSPQQIPMSSLNQSDRSIAASHEDRNKRKNQNCYMSLIIIIMLFTILLLFIIAVTALSVITLLRLSIIEAALKRNIESEIEQLKANFSSERARNELKNELQDNATIILNQTLLKLSEDVEDVNMSVNTVENANRVYSYLSIFQNSISYSCSEIGAKLNFSNSSGYYVVWSAGVLRSVYCDLTRTFGGTSKGWMRVAELDVNNCPPGMRTETVNTSTTCKVSEDGAGCTEIYFPVYNISYTQVTGRIRAYQINTSDGFTILNSMLRPANNMNLRSNYLDGVSITSNDFHHIWSFAAGCTCMQNTEIPMGIGSHYICDGLIGTKVTKPHEELVWENQQCGGNSSWFFRNLTSSTADILLRICRDQDRADEDLAITNLELYVM